MRKLIDQNNIWFARQNSINVEFGKLVSPVFDDPARQNRERRNQRFGVSPTMGFDNADDNIPAVVQQFRTFAQHFERLADTGGCP